MIADGEMRDAKFTADVLVRKAAGNAKSNLELAVSQVASQGGTHRGGTERQANRVIFVGRAFNFDAGRCELLDTCNRVFIMGYQNEEP